MEQFKEHPIYKGYMVGEFGTVKGIHGKKLSNIVLHTGHLAVETSSPKRRHRLHTFVAETWLGKNVDNLAIIFKDGDKTNCRASNLEFSKHRKMPGKKSPECPEDKKILPSSFKAFIEKRLNELSSEIAYLDVNYQRTGRNKTNLKMAREAFKMNSELLKQLSSSC
jgi:hypothetical protein